MENRKKIEYKLIRSNRKTVEIQVHPEGIVVRAPYDASDQAVRDFVESKRRWIETHQAMLEEETKKAEGEGQEPSFTMEEIEALAEKAAQVIPERVRHYAPLVGVRCRKITIRNQRTRWGSCSAKGNLNFNCLLMLFPMEVIDSVVVHELCHLKYMNHSPEFYAEVERVYPEYRKWNRWLKENGAAYMKRMP